MALVPDDPTQRNALLVGLLVVVAFYFLFWDMWYVPRGDEIAEMETRLEQLEDQNRAAQILATRGGDQLQERLDLFERHVSQLEQLIPEREEVPALLNNMSAEARRTGVDISLLRPEPAQTGEFYSRQTYEMEVIGSYHDVGRFLTAIASLSRIISPIDMDITPFTGDAAVVDVEDPVVARFRIQTYVLPSDEGGGADEGGGGGEQGGDAA